MVLAFGEKEISKNPSLSRLAVKGRQWLFERLFLDIRMFLQPLGIPFIVLKGPHVGVLAYDASTERQYLDLDILVMPSDFHQVARVLQQHGFVPHAELMLASWENASSWNFRSPQGLWLDVHRGFSESHRQSMDIFTLFAQAKPFTFGETEALGLADEDLLAYLCIHAGKRAFSTLEAKHLQDIAGLVLHQKLDWEVYLRRIEAAKAKTVAYYALSAACRQGSACIPEEIIRKLKPGKARATFLDRQLHLDRFPISSLQQKPSPMLQRLLILNLQDGGRLHYLFSSCRLRIMDRLLQWHWVRVLWLKKHAWMEPFHSLVDV